MMKKCVLEQYYKEGWLQYGNAKLRPEDRLYAGYVFYKSYMKSHVLSVGVSCFEVPKKDSVNRLNAVEAGLCRREEFLNAYEHIPRLSRPVVEEIVLENKVIHARKHDRCFVADLLCAGLDALALYYISASKKNDNTYSK